MKKLLLFVSLIIGATISTTPANAQCSGVGDGTGGGIYCLYPDSIHDCLYLGGGFQHAGNDTLNHCGFWNDSAYFHLGNQYHGTNDSVWCFVHYNGNIYVGGSFTQAGGIQANHIAMWDGNAWHAVGNGFNNDVMSLCVYNGQLYAGGAFTSSGSSTMNHIAYWNGSNWNQFQNGANGNVETMYVWNNNLCFGGDFTSFNNANANRFCFWNGTDFTFPDGGFSNNGQMGNCHVQSLCEYDGHLYAGGMFSHAGQHNMHNLAMWNGTSWTSIGDVQGGMMGGNSNISALCVFNGELYVGGNFGSCGGNQANNLGVWNGSSWSTIGTGMNGRVRSMAVYNGYLYIGGEFTDAAGTSVSNIAKYSSSTGLIFANINNDSIHIYPNPTSKNLNLEWNQQISGNVVLTIYSITGKIVYSNDFGNLPAGPHRFTYAISEQPNGIYLVAFMQNHQQITRRITVIK